MFIAILISINDMIKYHKCNDFESNTYFHLFPQVISQMGLVGSLLRECHKAKIKVSTGMCSFIKTRESIWQNLLRSRLFFYEGQMFLGFTGHSVSRWLSWVPCSYRTEVPISLMTVGLFSAPEFYCIPWLIFPMPLKPVTVDQSPFHASSLLPFLQLLISLQLQPRKGLWLLFIYFFLDDWSVLFITMLDAACLYLEYYTLKCNRLSSLAFLVKWEIVSTLT